MKKRARQFRIGGAIYMEVSKTYDCLPHGLLIAKLEACCLQKPSLDFVNDYLNFQKQRTKIGSSYSNWASVIRVFPRDLF